MAGSEELVPRFDPELLQARWALGGVDPEELANQALSALEQGFTGIALQQLAGLTHPNVGDLGTLPERTFADLGLAPLNKEQALTALIARGQPATSEVIRSALSTFPAFSGRWRRHIESWGGNPAGSYNDMAEFVHFVIEDLFDEGNLDELRGVFQFMERLLVGGDQETRDLIGLGFFETLQNVASWRTYGYEAFEPFLGSVSKKIWSEIRQTWVGKSSLADVVRAERNLG
jgi:hypothetical protein